jgi:CheY-like chemotaxis protein
MRVLVVDDVQANRELIKAYLDDYDCEVLEASDGFQAITMVAISDIVLCDLAMPVMDGYKFIDLVRTKLHLQTPIIVISASPDYGESMRRGANAFLLKPISCKELIDGIERLT